MKQTSPLIFVHLFIVLVLDLLAFTCILPLLPSLMDYYAQESVKGDFYSTLTDWLGSFQNFVGIPQNHRYNAVLFAGFLGSMFSFLQFLSSPIFGTLSDVKGRKPMFILSVVGSVVSYLIWSQSDQFYLFILSRLVCGLCKCSVSVATAIIADISPVKYRGRGMVLIGAAFSVGFIVGPMIGAYFAQRSKSTGRNLTFPHLPAYFAVGLTLMELVWLTLFLPETLNVKSKINWRQTFERSIKFISIKSLFSLNNTNKRIGDQNKESAIENLRAVQTLGLVNFTFLLIYSGLEFTLTFFTHLFFGFNSMQQGQIYFVVGLLMVAIQGAYVRRVPSDKQLSVAGQGLVATCVSFLMLALTSLTNSKVMLYSSLILFSFGSATVVTSLTTALSSYTSEDEQGAMLGLFRSLGALARALGPFIASAAFWLFGAAICYGLGGLAILLPFFILRRAKTPPAPICCTKASTGDTYSNAKFFSTAARKVKG